MVSKRKVGNYFGYSTKENKVDSVAKKPLQGIYDLIDDRLLHNIYLYQEGAITLTELKKRLEQYAPAIFDMIQAIYLDEN